MTNLFCLRGALTQYCFGLRWSNLKVYFNNFSFQKTIFTLTLWRVLIFSYAFKDKTNTPKATSARIWCFFLPTEEKHLTQEGSGINCISQLVVLWSCFQHKKPPERNRTKSQNNHSNKCIIVAWKRKMFIQIQWKPFVWGFYIRCIRPGGLF